VKNTPDYYNTCADSFTNASVPTNGAGTQWPFEGNAYMGLISYYRYEFWREIIGTTLIDTLFPGNTYHISMRVSRGNVTIQNYGCGAANKLGMRFTTYEYSLSDTPRCNNYAQIYEDTIITDTLNWVLIAWDYVPDSLYTHVYIGNFFDDSHTDTISIGNNDSSIYPGMNAYYFIDSVNITCSGNNCLRGQPSEGTTLFYNINNYSIYMQNNPDISAKLRIVDVIGQTIEEFEIINIQQVYLGNLATGLYLAIIQSENTNLTKKIIVNK
jgi:hypothetical protein